MTDVSLRRDPEAPARRTPNVVQCHFIMEKKFSIVFHHTAVIEMVFMSDRRHTPFGAFHYFT